MNRFSRIAFLLGCFLIATLLFAQFETAEVLGTVRDPSGGAIPQANVTLVNMDTGISAKTTTDENGNYDFFNVRVGRYSVVVEHSGFNKFTTTNVAVNVNARQRVDVTMTVGAVTESVEVSGVAAALETDSSEHGQVINTQQVVELPLNGRNYSDLALLTTNTHKSPLASNPSTPREGAFNVNGMRSTYNNFLLDGLDNNAYSTSNQGFSSQVANPSPDAVAEFKVITSNFSAEYGRVGGAVVNAVMRSGTNRIRGTLFEFLRNTDLNAIGYVFGVRPATFQKPTLQRNQFGATIGGPIVKNKIFFFGDYEGYRSLQKVLNFDTIPNMNDRAGILPVAVVNPVTGVVYPAGTAIPMTAFAKKVLNDLPSVAAGTGRSNDFQQTIMNPRDYADKYDAKVDAQINDRMTTFLRFSQRKDNQYYQPTLSGPSGGDGNGYVRALSQTAGFGFTWTPTAASILEFRLGFTHIVAGKQPPFLGGASMQDLYGVTGLPTFPQLTGGLNTQNIGGFTSVIGRQATNPQFQNPTTYDPKVNYSTMKGRHALKMGAEMQIVHTEVMDINPVYGLLGYSGGFSKPTCAQLGLASGCSVPSDTASYNLADFMFGLPGQVQLSNYLVGNYRQRLYFLYGQDDFRVNSKLTLNLGLRWEYASPRWERDNVLSNFDPTTSSMLLAKSGGVYDRTLVNPDYKDFAPRIGLAYSFTTKTVFRSGYGISYVHLNRLGSADELGINGPQVVFGNISQSPLLSNGQPNPAFISPQTGFPPTLASPASFNPLTANVAYLPKDTRWPYVQTWFASLQRELIKHWVAEVAYTGSHSVRLPIIADYNQALPNPLTATCNATVTTGCLGIQPRRPNQAFGAVTWVDPAGFTSYNGLSVRLEHRFASGLYLLNSFTWEKALGNSEQALEYPTGATAANPQNIYNLSAERGPSSFDVKLINVTSLVYQLPFGKGRKLGANWKGPFDAVLGGWEITSINTANTGLPLNVFYTPSATMDGTSRIADYRGLSVQRPNLVGDPTGQTGPAMLDHYWNSAAFAIPSVNAPYGNLSRNAFRMPNFWQWDLGVDKSFKIPAREGMALQFRSEFFNILNHTNFGPPTCDITNAAFGTIRSTFPPRQIQFALKLLF
ncbi:MAG TPA: TonB-dependent receptor [Bryobacteraceae bacterium]|nr:TonB-dependent receptor [Bryobacteraceae bacterium]